jgi:outer membrane protein, multidrug efflux system
VVASDFFTGGSRFFSLGPAIRWPIFNAGRIRQNLKDQNLRQEQALLAYEQAVLIAIEAGECARRLPQAQLRLHKLTEAEKAQQRAVMLARGGDWEEDLARKHALR